MVGFFTVRTALNMTSCCMLLSVPFLHLCKTKVERNTRSLPAKKKPASPGDELTAQKMAKVTFS